jgi:hypothetical protein
MDKTKRTVDADLNSLLLSIAHLEDSLQILSVRLEPISLRTPVSIPNSPVDVARSEIGERIHSAESIIRRCAHQVQGMILDLDIDTRTESMTCSGTGKC